MTAEFNRNVLHVINANLGADLDPDRFEHVAFYNEAERRIEMRLRAREEMRARIDALEMDVGFEPGEQIRTEISCKFTRETLAREYRAAGLELLGWYTDPDGLFALSLTGPRDLTPPAAFPDPVAVAACEAYASLGLLERAPRERPYVVANMVTTADGRASLGGRTEALSSDADRELFHCAARPRWMP